MALENWLPTKYPGYGISDQGRIFSWKTGRYLCQGPDGQGYPKAVLSLNGRLMSVATHRLVLETFRPTILAPALEAMHMDNNRQNSRLDNLEWGTHKQNEAMKKWYRRGKKKLTPENVAEIFLSKEKQINLAERFKIPQPYVSLIKSRKIWKSVTAKFVGNTKTV